MYYQAGYAAGLALTLMMGLSVIVLQPRRREARLWALLSLWVSCWFLIRFLMCRAQTEVQAREIMRWAYIPIALINPTYYHFCLALVRRRITRLVYAGYALAVGIGLLNAYSHLLVSGVIEGRYSAFYERGGPFYWIELINYVVFPALGVSVLFTARRTADAFKKRQLDYMLAAAAIGFLCGLTTMPLVYRLHIPPFAAPLVAIYPMVSTYAILRHQLLDIRIIIRRTLIYSILTAFFSALYVTVLVIGSHVLDRWMSSPSWLSSGAAAALVAILFHPFRVRLDRWVDRRFPRESLDPVLFQEATSTFAHEVKRPLVNISLPAQLALMDLENLKTGAAPPLEVAESVARRLHFIIEESHAAGEKIEAIRELSATTRPEHTPLDIRVIVGQVITTFSAQAEKEGVDLIVEQPEEGLFILGNQRQLEIALGNLVNNSLDALRGHQPAAREIIISVNAIGKQICLDIADSGPGIPIELTGRIFDPWFTTKGSKGMGIGLYIAQQILHRHGGTLETKKRAPVSGSIFNMKLPRIF